MSYEGYTLAELLLDATLREVTRVTHNYHKATLADIFSDWEQCTAFPCRMAKARLEQAQRMINRRTRENEEVPEV